MSKGHQVEVSIEFRGIEYKATARVTMGRNGTFEDPPEADEVELSDFVAMIPRAGIMEPHPLSQEEEATLLENLGEEGVRHLEEAAVEGAYQDLADAYSDAEPEEDY